MDDHGTWKLASAYDLTFSSGPGGEQSTTVLGEGRSPEISHLIRLGQEVRLPKKLIDEIIDSTRSALNRWRESASNHNISKANIQLIAKTINR